MKQQHEDLEQKVQEVTAINDVKNSKEQPIQQVQPKIMKVAAQQQKPYQEFKPYEDATVNDLQQSRVGTAPAANLEFGDSRPYTASNLQDDELLMRPGTGATAPIGHY